MLASFVEFGLGLGQPSRPDPVDQYPGAIASCGRVVDAPYLYLRLLRHPSYDAWGVLVDLLRRQARRWSRSSSRCAKLRCAH